ncbi:MAG: MFS transporter [Candidatus Hodarchaeota archaeon]
MSDPSNGEKRASKNANNLSYIAKLKLIFRSRNFVVILLTNYTGSIFLAAFIYLNLYFRDVGISYFELGLANAWAALVGLVGIMLGGYSADMAGGKHRKLMATFNKFFITIAALVIATATDFLGLLFAWTVFGISQFCQSSIDPILFESLPPEHLGTGTSLFTLTGIFGLIGLMLVGVLIQDGFVEGMRIFWLLAAVVSFIDFVIRLVLLDQTGMPQEVEVKELKSFARNLIQEYRSGIKVAAAAIPLFLFVFLLDVMSDICYQFAQLFYLNEDVEMSYESINYVMIGATFIGVIGGLFAGSLLDKSESEAKVMFLAYFLLPFAVLLLLFSPTYPEWTNVFPSSGFYAVMASTAFVAVVIKAGNDVVWRTIAWGAVGRKLPREHTGKVMALLSMSISIMAILIMPIVGFIYETQGGVPLLSMALVLNIVILSSLLWGWLRSIGKKAEQMPDVGVLETSDPEITVSQG